MIMKRVAAVILMVSALAVLIACGTPDPTPALQAETALPVAQAGVATSTEPVTDTPSPVPPTETSTPTPVPPTATPTPSHPVFTADEALEVASISDIVGEGTVAFAAGDEPGTLRVDVDGSIPIVDGNWCLGCVDTIRLAPDLQVPTHPFFIETEAPDPAGGLAAESMDLDIVLSAPIEEDATEFIVSGPEGVTLRKEGRAFSLVEGNAYLLQTEEGAVAETEPPAPAGTVEPGPESISWEEASDRIGATVQVCGEAVTVAVLLDNRTILNLGELPQDGGVIVVVTDSSMFAEGVLTDMYGDNVCVTGEIVQDDSNAGIMVTDPSQVEVVD